MTRTSTATSPPTARMPASASPAPATPASISAAAKSLYTSGPFILRHLQHYRPYICPFHKVLDCVPPGASILDVGCGGGLFLGLLAHAGRISRGIGFDCAGPVIRLAKDMAASAGFDSLTFLHLAVEDPWPEGQFDVVSIMDVIHHVPPAAHQSLIASAAAHVRPGGILLVKDIYPESRWRAAGNRLHDLLLARQWVHFVTGDQIREWAQAAGLRSTRRQRFNMLWYGHELQIFERPA